MGEIATSNTVIARDSMGQFIAQCEAAGERMMAAIAEDGAQMSRDLAPKGSTPDPRTVPLASSIESQSGSTFARWTASARHALAVEFGSSRHFQTGWARFFWDREGRDWEPGGNRIDHPAVGAQPYLRPAYEAMMARWMTYAQRFYPR